MSTAKRKQRDLNRHRGIPNRYPGDDVRAHITFLNRTMSIADIAVASGCSRSHIYRIIQGASVNKDTHARLLAVKPAPRGGHFIDVTGTRRRIRALQALGHTQDTIAAEVRTTQWQIHSISTRQKVVRYAFAQRVAEAYRVLAEEKGACAPARRRAAEAGWAPPAAWDDDTIDDPAASPEWTGCCGTDRGWWTHTLQRIPGCERCNAAHEEWKAEHRVLERSAYQAALMKSRASASTRGRDIAEDARELMRHGHTHETAAARLGVTQQHLYQELARHPAPAQAA